jgi:DNA-binding IclR family transcriptional regulator
MGTTRVAEIAALVAKTVHELTSKTVSVGILVEQNATIIISEEPRQTVGIAAPVGTTMPAHASAIGRALLSGLTDEEIDALYAHEQLASLTKNTVASRTELKQRLEQVRRTGLSFDRGGGFEGLEGIASPVRSANGRVVAAIVIPMPMDSVDVAERARLAQLVRLAGELASYKLGWESGESPLREVEDLTLWWQQQRPAGVT